MPDPLPRRILIRAPNWVGDAVMSLPALHCVRQALPHAHVSILALPWVQDLFAREPFADRIIPYHARRGARDCAAKWETAAVLRAERFDTALLLTNSFESAALVFAARIPVRIGYRRDARRWLLTRAVPVPAPGEIPEHQSFYYLELIRRAGWLEHLPPPAPIRLGGIDDARKAGAARFSDLGVRLPVIGLSPGAAYGGAKRWLPERFEESAAILARAWGASVALFGAAAESSICQRIASGLTGAGIAAHNLAGRTSLAEFISLAAACRVFLTNDSGSMHIASALGVATVAVFGATNHLATGPTGPMARTVRHPVDCSPYANPCMRRECPIDHRCMRAVTASEVAETALSLLK